MTRRVSIGASCVAAAMLSALTGPAGAGPASTPAASPKQLRVYMLGNSLTDNVKYDGFQKLAESRGFKHVWGRTMIPGSPIFWHWAHPNEGFMQPPFGHWPKALAEYEWDAFTLQPFSTYRNEMDSARKFIDLILKKSPNIQVYVHAQWMTRDKGDFASYWLQELDPNSPRTGTAAYYERFTEDLRKSFPAIKPPRLIPVGHALFLLDQKIKAGLVPGVKSIFELWNDGIHLGNVGSYVCGCGFFATIYGQDPVGLPVVDAYALDPASGRGRAIGPALAKLVQETVWEAVTGNPLTGVTSDQPVKVATPIVPEAVLKKSWEFALLAAMGKGPYRWSLAGGQLPPGVQLAQDGKLAGAPTAEGEFRFQVQVADAAGATARKDLSLRVVPDSKPKIVTTDLSPARQAEPYRQQLKAEGGNGPLTWRLARNQKLPEGLELQLEGTITGSPAEPGAGKFRVEVVDSDLISPDADARDFALKVEPAAGEVAFAREVDEKTTIDGKCDESFWKLDRKIEKLVVGGPAKVQACFDVAWSKDALLLAIRVKGSPGKAGDKDPSKNDSVEIYIDSLHDRQTAYNADDRRIVIDAANRIDVVGNKREIKSAVQKTPDGYIVEVSVGWRNLGIKAGPRVIGLDVGVNEAGADGKMTRQVWRGTKDDATDPSNFAPVVLKRAPASQPATGG
jgi:hypothetical protein